MKKQATMNKAIQMYHRPLTWSVLATALLGACDAQRSPSYMGEPIMMVRGNIVNDRTDPAPEARVAAVWGTFGAMFAPLPSLGPATQADIVGIFPEGFVLTFYEPPPEEALFNPALSFSAGYFDPSAESRIALARIQVVVSEDETQLLGAAERHVVVYVEKDIGPQTAAEAMLSARLTAGYHLMEVSQVPENESSVVIACHSAAQTLPEWKACGVASPLSLAAAGATIGVRLVDELAQLQFPSYSPVYWPQGHPLPGPHMPPHCSPMGMPVCP